VFLSETDPGLSFLVSPNAVSLAFPEETGGKRVSNSSFRQKHHLPQATYIYIQDPIFPGPLVTVSQELEGMTGFVVSRGHCGHTEGHSTHGVSNWHVLWLI
jgi:hypothetical protein